jgi:hypothetical protein
MSEETLSRRTFIHRVGVWTALAASSGMILQACGGDSSSGGDKTAEMKCDDLSKLTDAEKAQRTALGYIEKSTQEGKSCTTCQQHVVPAKETDCGTCKVVPGPINPNGYCNVWVQKTA